MLDLPLAVLLPGASLLLILVTMGLLIAVLLRLRTPTAGLTKTLEDKHLEMVRDINAALNGLGDRLTGMQSGALEQLRNTLTQELTQTRSTVGALQVRQVEELSATRETMTLRLSEMSKDMQIKHDQLRTEVITQVLEKIVEQNRAE